jgi:hypothetical protein
VIQDIKYLTPIIQMIEAEKAEAKALDSMEVVKTH